MKKHIPMSSHNDDFESNGTFYVLKQTSKTPYIYINKKIGEMEIKGRSIPENAIEFYQNIKTEFNGIKLSELILNIDLEYFNSSSNKCIFDLLLYLKSNIEKFQINWYIDPEDEDMIEQVDYMKNKFNIKSFSK